MTDRASNQTKRATRAAEYRKLPQTDPSRRLYELNRLPLNRRCRALLLAAKPPSQEASPGTDYLMVEGSGLHSLSLVLWYLVEADEPGWEKLKARALRLDQVQRNDPEGVQELLVVIDPADSLKSNAAGTLAEIDGMSPLDAASLLVENLQQALVENGVEGLLKPGAVSE